MSWWGEMHKDKPVRLRGAGAKQPSPYLKEWHGRLFNMLARQLGAPVTRLPYVADLASGNGRNTQYLRNMGCHVYSFDMEPGAPDTFRWKAGEQLRIWTASVDIVLCQYLLMFLSDAEICSVLSEADRVLRTGGFIIIELQDVKSGRAVNLNRVREYLDMTSSVGRYSVLHAVKDRRILQKVSRL